MPGDFSADEAARLSMVGRTTGLYVTDDDTLRISTFGSLTGLILTVRVRAIGLDGQSIVTGETHVPNSDRTVATSVVRIGAGWLLGCEAFVSTGSPRRGQLFVLVEVVRGSGTTGTPLQTLIQDYATDTSRLSWPGSAIRSSAEGPGVVRLVAGSAPAAGAEISETVPTNARWRPLSIFTSLVTDGNAANRDVSLTLDDGATVWLRAPAGQNHIASLTTRYVWSPQAVRFTIAGDRTITVPIPDTILMGGSRIRTVTTAVQVGDQYAAPQLLVEEWIED